MAAADDTPPARSRIPALDGLRGIAVLLVLLAHSSNVQMFLLRRGEYGLDFRGCGRAGVFLFFVLSAFLLTSQALERGGSELTRPATWGRYLLRRVLRVYPAYLMCLLLYMGLEGWSLQRVGAHLSTFRAELHFWTVPVELHFYLVLPLILLVIVPALRRLGERLLFLLLLVAAVGLRLLQPPDYGSRAPDFEVRLLPFMPVFLTGCAAAVLHHGWSRLPEERRARRAPLLDMAAVAAMVALSLHAPAVLSLFTEESVDLHRFHLEFDRFGVLWGILILGLLHGTGRLRAPLESRALRWVGVTSFSTYLLHRLVLERVELPTRDWPQPLGVLTFLGLSLGLGALSWWLLERPFASLGSGVRRSVAKMAADSDGG